MSAQSPALAPTPSQTVGPYLHLGLTWPDGEYVVPEGTPGAVRVTGRLYDGAGEPVTDGMVEVWQADPEGHYAHPEDPSGDPRDPAFRGFGRAMTLDGGSFSFLTVKPGRVPDNEGGRQAPHLAVSVFARGVVKRLATRLYFADEADANAEDVVLRGLPDEAARTTLIATPTAAGYALDIRLRGARETVFFDV